MQNKLFFLLISIIAFVSCEKQCFEGYVFHFKTTNDLTTTEIERGDSITITIEVPQEALSTSDSLYYMIDNFDFYVQVNFRKYVSAHQRFNLQQQAFEDFDFHVIQGQELSVEEIGSGNILPQNALYMLLDKNAPTREIIFSITPKRTGTYFIYLESDFDLLDQYKQRVYDDDDCFDSTFYDFYNASNNDYSFLEGEIQDTTSRLKQFIKHVAGLGFIVK